MSHADKVRNKVSKDFGKNKSTSETLGVNRTNRVS